MRPLSLAVQINCTQNRASPTGNLQFGLVLKEVSDFSSIFGPVLNRFRLPSYAFRPYHFCKFVVPGFSVFCFPLISSGFFDSIRILRVANRL